MKIYLQNWDIYRVNDVGKYSSTMEHMATGYRSLFNLFCHTLPVKVELVDSDEDWPNSSVGLVPDMALPFVCLTRLRQGFYQWPK